MPPFGSCSFAFSRHCTVIHNVFVFFSAFSHPDCSFFLCICVGCSFLLLPPPIYHLPSSNRSSERSCCCCCVELCFILNYGFCFVVFCQNHILFATTNPPANNWPSPHTHFPSDNPSSTHLHAWNLALVTLRTTGCKNTILYINKYMFTA